MYRGSTMHSAATGASKSAAGVTNPSPNKREATNNISGGGSSSSSSNNNNNSPTTTVNDNVPSTIREIRSKTIGGVGTSQSATRLLLANKRQAMSMERLNGQSSMSNVSSSASMNNMHNFSGDKGDKSSSMNGSCNSISGSAASSPSRGSSASSNAGGLNRTASRVSRFRSAKAVFERLSSASTSKPERPLTSGGGSLSERPRGTVASRYAAAAAARGAAAAASVAASGSSSASSSTALSSPRSRMSSVGKSPLRSHAQTSARTSVGGDATQANSVGKLHHTNSPNSPKSNDSATAQAQRAGQQQPRPQPRVITTATRRTPIATASQTATPSNATPTTTTTKLHQGADAAKRTSAAPASNKSNSVSSSASNISATSSVAAKPPPKDLIDKIVLEIVRDANNEHDANCTIQDLSNCDISGIPETLDFDKCFQDVEMMTEEEARKLLSRKSECPAASSSSAVMPITSPNDEPKNVAGEPEDLLDICGSQDALPHQHASNTPTRLLDIASAPDGTNLGETGAPEEDASSDSLIPSGPTQGAKYKVRFSDEPVAVYDTHAASDYDRRNDDIDPIAASAEYEIEKSRERAGIRNDEDEDEDDEKCKNDDLLNGGLNGRQKGVVGAVIESFNNQQHHPTTGIMKTPPATTYEDYQAGSHNPQCAAVAAGHGADRRDSSDNNHRHEGDDSEDQASLRREYIEFLEREVSIKRILEQNLRDLQSQYYESVKQLDSYKDEAEKRVAKLDDELAELRNGYESSQGELADAREQSEQFEKQLNDIKESSQLLEKKYHRAKRIIKDMQSREESFTRREQLYQQKLDEIEHELGVLISTIDRTIYEDGLKYFSFSNTTDNNNGTTCTKQHQTRLDVLGLIKKMMENFESNKKTQSVQIKQRIVTMLEQQLASLLANSNGCTTISTGPVFPIPPVVATTGSKPVSTSNVSKINHLISSNNNNNNNNEDDGKHSSNKNHPYASHRLSQPNMPHPIGVGGQPTKIFHGLSTMPISATVNEPSPPQSVNSYPSTNSLNSLNNNNNNNNGHQTSCNTTGISQTSSKLQEHHHQGTSLGDADGSPAQPATSLSDEVFKSMPADAQVPYQTDEWHDKPVSEWTTTQVSTWLLALGLDQYISKFEDRNVNGQSLINLDSTVLKGLGVLNSNDRNLLKKKIRELRVEMEKERKIIEKKMKENLKEKSKVQAPSQTNKQSSWKKSLLS